MAMRVLYCEAYYTHRSESYVALEVDYMKRQGVDVRVWANALSESPYPAEQVPVYRKTFAEAIDDFKPDLIAFHFHSVLLRQEELLSKMGIPVTLRGHSVDQSRSQLEILINRPWLKRIYCFPKFAEQFLGHPKIKPLTSTYDPRLYYQSPKDTKKVIRTGAGLPYKALEDFVKASTLCPDHKFTLVFGSPVHKSNYIDSLNALNQSLGGHTDIKVDLTHEATAELTRESAIFLHTYNPEAHPFGMPVGVLEAAATGSYVLFREDGWARAYASLLGLRCDMYRNVEEAAHLIKETAKWKDYEWASLQSSNATFASSFSDDKVLSKMLDDWKSITKK
jgi:hypothetical protein